MAFRNSQTIRALYQASQIRQSSYLLGSSKIYSNGISNEVGQLNIRKMSSLLFKDQNVLPWTRRSAMTLGSVMASELAIFKNDTRFASTLAKAPSQARLGSLQVSMLSPGFVYEPYAPREKIPFWQRWFTRTGWRKTKDDIILELKNAYTIAKLRKSGYSKQQFYKDAVGMYKEINTMIANGDKSSLRKAVTERMYSALKNELKQRESRWNKVYWELVEPVVKIRTLRARLIGVDRNDTNKVFVQVTIEFLSKQKFEAYNSNGSVVAGDKSKEVLVKDIWVFEKSLFHTGAYWRLCGRISL